LETTSEFFTNPATQQEVEKLFKKIKKRTTKAVKRNPKINFELILSPLFLEILSTLKYLRFSYYSSHPKL
jgi:hypothetical protein